MSLPLALLPLLFDAQRPERSPAPPDDPPAVPPHHRAVVHQVLFVVLAVRGADVVGAVVTIVAQLGLWVRVGYGVTDSVLPTGIIVVKTYKLGVFSMLKLLNYFYCLAYSYLSKRVFFYCLRVMVYYF